MLDNARRLTAFEVAKIKAHLPYFSNEQIAAKFKISETQARRIRIGEIWASVKPDIYNKDIAAFVTTNAVHFDC